MLIFYIKVYIFIKVCNFYFGLFLQSIDTFLEKIKGRIISIL